MRSSLILVFGILSLAFLAEQEAVAQKKPTLRGSNVIQEEQNLEADKENLIRIEDAAQLADFVRNGILVPLPQTENIEIDGRLEPGYRYCQPWVRSFLFEFGRDHHIVITSAVRTAESQRLLQYSNTNAAPARGPRASAHLTGAAIDITKKGMTLREQSSVREWLRRFKAQGRGIVIEEFRQAVFHIMVFNKETAVEKNVS